MTAGKVSLDGNEIEIDVDRDGPAWIVAQQGSPSKRIEVLTLGGNEAELLVDGVRTTVPFTRSADEVRFFLHGRVHTVSVVEKGRARRQRDHSMAAPMPGVVLKISVSEGDAVSKGGTLMILEAMKMEHQIVAPYDGTVASINCAVGELVQPGLELITIDPAGETVP